MHPYLPHLLADIKAAERQPNLPEEQLPASQTIEEQMEEIEDWISGENGPEHTFGYYCGLEDGNFPPPEHLSNEDQIQVCEAMEHLLNIWNAEIDLPEQLPLPLRYKLTVNILNEEFTFFKSGTWHFDYCTGYAPDCALGKYCHCLKFWNEEKSVD